MVPFMVVLITGVSGAFLTTSMQKASSINAPKFGYINGPNGPCSVPVQCNTTQNELCRVSYNPNGQQAKDKDSNCAEVLYRP